MRAQGTAIMTQANAEPNCISCHMPARTYMVVDPRHDHSIRIPRPDLSVKLGTPNACNNCHTDKSAQWAADAVERWFGPHRKGPGHYADAFHAAWTGRPSGETPRVRSRRRKYAHFRPRERAGGTRSPCFACQPRSGAEAAFPTPIRWCGSVRSTCLRRPCRPALAAPLASAYRIRSAACVRAPLRCSPRSRPNASRRPTVNASTRAADEFVAAHRLNADRPEARATLANFLVQRGKHSRS